jgi:hypothetical protein
MAFALFLLTKKISNSFATKAEAWEFARQCGLVTVVPSHDEDPPRRILALKYSIIHVSDDPSSNNLTHAEISTPVDPVATKSLNAN